MKTHSYPDYFSTLYIPTQERSDYQGLLAFRTLLDTRLLTQQDLLGVCIRLQWWRDVFYRKRDAEAQGHPVAKRLLGLLDREILSCQDFIVILDGYASVLEQQPIENDDDLTSFAQQTHGAFFRLFVSYLMAAPERHAQSALPCETRHMQRLCHQAAVVTFSFWLLETQISARKTGIHLTDEIYQTLSFLPAKNPLSERNKINALCRLIMIHMKNVDDLWHTDCPPFLKAVFLPLSLIPKTLRAIHRKGGRHVSPFARLRMQWDLWRFARNTIHH